MKIKRLIIIRKLIPKILTAYLRLSEEELKLVESFLSAFQSRLETRGLEDTLLYFKSVRLIFTRWLSGHPISDPSENRILKPWISLIKSDPDRYFQRLKCLMTLLTIGRAFRTPAKLDLETIISESKEQSDITSEELLEAARRLKIKKGECYFKSFHLSTKSGPNGPAMATAIVDLATLDLNTKHYISLVGGDVLEYAMRKPFMQALGTTLVNITKTLYGKIPKHPRKLSYFSDKEGKTRVIGILDYWTQTALRPLHFHLMDILKGIKTDCTFNQANFSKWLSLGPYHSLDLSAATDRMPLSLQKRVISIVIGEERAEAWGQLLTTLGFKAKGIDDFIYYKAGQPMGAYSSWASMALTHHVIVQIAAMRAGYNRFFWQYVILGDDLVIGDGSVAAQYKLLCSKLDMPISEAKSHVSLDTYEFAKRWVHKGVEITGFSIAGLLETWKRYSLLYEFLENQAAHGWQLCDSGKPGLISDIYSVYGRSSERVIKLFILYQYIKKVQTLLKAESSQYSNALFIQCNKLYLELCKITGLNVLLPDLQSEDSVPPFIEVISGLLREVKATILENEIGRLFSTNDAVSDKLNAEFKSKFPDLSDQHYRALLRECSPAIQVLNDQLRATIDYVNRLASNDPNLNIFELGIARFFIAEGIFSMRTAHSISLAESQLTKWLLYMFRLHVSRNSLILQVKPYNIEFYHPNKMREREAFFRRKAAEKRKSRVKSGSLGRDTNKSLLK